MPPTTNFPDASVFTEEEAIPAADADAQAAAPIAGLPCVPFDLELRLRYEAACANPNPNPNTNPNPNPNPNPDPDPNPNPNQAAAAAGSIFAMSGGTVPG